MRFCGFFGIGLSEPPLDGGAGLDDDDDDGPVGRD
jgi:hypothetical protein